MLRHRIAGRMWSQPTSFARVLKRIEVHGADQHARHSRCTTASRSPTSVNGEHVSGAGWRSRSDRRAPADTPDENAEAPAAPSERIGAPESARKAKAVPATGRKFHQNLPVCGALVPKAASSGPFGIEDVNSIFEAAEHNRRGKRKAVSSDSINRIRPTMRMKRRSRGSRP